MRGGEGDAKQKAPESDADVAASEGTLRGVEGRGGTQGFEPTRVHSS